MIGVYRGDGESSISLNMSKSRGVGPGLDMHEIGTGVLGLVGTTAFGGATGCGIEAARRLPVTTADEKAWAAGGSGGGLSS
jgi:hypothetical protein